MLEKPPTATAGPGNTAPSSGQNTPDHAGSHGGPASHAGSAGGNGDGQPNSVKQEEDVKPPGSVGDVKPPGSIGGGGGGGPNNMPGNSDATADLFDSFDSKDGGRKERKRAQLPLPLVECDICLEVQVSLTWLSPVVCHRPCGFLFIGKSLGFGSSSALARPQTANLNYFCELHVEHSALRPLLHALHRSGCYVSEWVERQLLETLLGVSEMLGGCGRPAERAGNRSRARLIPPNFCVSYAVRASVGRTCVCLAVLFPSSLAPQSPSSLFLSSPLLSFRHSRELFSFCVVYNVELGKRDEPNDRPTDRTARITRCEWGGNFSLCSGRPNINSNQSLL